MTTEHQLRLQHQQERESLIQEQGAEREQILTQQQGRMQEQQAAFMQLQVEYQQEPTAAREHAILMTQQSIQHLQELFHQQQSHVLERHQHDQLRLQERQWHQEQLLLQQLQQQRLQQIGIQPLSPSALSPGTPGQGQGQGLGNHYFGYQGQQQHSQHPQQYVHHSPQQQHQQQQQLQQQPLQQQQHQQQEQYQQQQDLQHQPLQHRCSDTEAMDVDDEATLLSIASTITSLRQHSSRPDASSIGSWALDSVSSSSKDRGFEAVVVLDTNVLLSHLNFLRSLVAVCDTKYNGANSHTKAVFIVPWVVIQELDGLKVDRGRRGGEVDVVDKARRAIKYIQDELEKPENKRSLRGQKIGECLEKRETNDDYILDCCQYFQSELGTDKKTKVTLFSNDRNLCVKAMIHEVATLSHGKIDFEVEPVMAAIFGSKSPKNSGTNRSSMETDSSVLDASIHNPHNISGSGGVAKVGSGKGTYKTVVNQRELQRIKSTSKVVSAPAGMDSRLFELTTHIIIRLRRYLEFAVPDHLRSYYGTEWKNRTRFDDNCTKPEDMQWDCRRLAHPISLLQTFWRPVFTDLYHSASQSNKARTHLDNLHTFIKTWDRVETFGLGKVYKKDLTAFLDDVDAILAGVLIKPPSSSTPTELSPEDIAARESMYDAAIRIRTIKDWKTHCSMLE
ncbi:RNA endoribonuclease [Mortierella antarctica]|nr:RNA endoribonuclease [Mortierella antarctica]